MINRFRSAWSAFWGGPTTINDGFQDSGPGGYAESSAAVVNEDTAMQVDVVWSCARLLAETFASLPVQVYQRGSPGEVASDASSLLDVLALSPNSRQTPVEFYETMQLNLVLHGNAYARIQRTVTGRVVALWPLSATATIPYVLKDGTVVYHHKHGSDYTVYAESDILHVRFLGNGLVGLSPLAYARNAVGLGSAIDSYSAKFFKNGGKPSGVLYINGAANKAQRQEIREAFAEIVSEVEYEKRLVVLPKGEKFEPIQMSPADLELLEMGRVQTSKILRFMGNIPGPLVGHMAESTVWGSGIESMFLAWYRTGLNPYASRWEQAIEKKLMTSGQRLRWKVEFDFSALLRGDSKTQAEVLTKQVGGPVLTPNEGRGKLGLPPLVGGDELNPSPTQSKNDSNEKVQQNA